MVQNDHTKLKEPDFGGQTCPGTVRSCLVCEHPKMKTDTSETQA